MNGHNSQGLKFKKRSGLYTNSTKRVSYNPTTKTAFSYGWQFVDVVKGLVFFNSFSYSSTTNRHQRDVRNTMRNLGHDINYTVSYWGSLNVTEIMQHYYNELFKEEVYYNRKGIRTYNKESSLDRIEKLKEVIKDLESKGFSLSKKEVKELKIKSIETEKLRLESLRKHVKITLDSNLLEKMNDLTEYDTSIEDSFNNMNEL